MPHPTQDKNFRLPLHARPSRHQATLTLSLDQKSFSGHQLLELQLDQPTSELTLHGIDLKLEQVSIRGSDGQSLQVAEVTASSESETLTLRFDKPVRIGVNGGSLNQELVMAKMQENTDRALGKDSEEVLNECMVISALESTALAIECGLRADQIIISCKVSRPNDLIAIYRELARQTTQPLHLGLTEAGMGYRFVAPGTDIPNR